MTVAELVAKLQTMPQDQPIEILIGPEGAPLEAVFEHGGTVFLDGPFCHDDPTPEEGD